MYPYGNFWVLLDLFLENINKKKLYHLKSLILANVTQNTYNFRIMKKKRVQNKVLIHHTLSSNLTRSSHSGLNSGLIKS